MALANVTLQYQYFADPTRGRPIALGSVFVGVVDTDPETPANQLEIFAKQEDGTEVSINQPVSLSAGGVPQLNGSPIRILVDGTHSLKVLNSGGGQVYYLNDSIEGTAITPFGESLISAADADAGRVIMNSMEKVSVAVTNNVVIFDDEDEAKDSGVPFVRTGNAAGAADIITVAFAIPVTVITDGLETRVKALTANTTTTPTINYDGLGAKTIVKNGNQVLAIGDIPGPDFEMQLVNNLGNDNVELLNPVGKPFTSTEQIITTAGTLSLSHGLSAKPSFVNCWLICKIAEAGFSIDDELQATLTQESSTVLNNNGINIKRTATTVDITFGSNTLVFPALNDSTGAGVSLTNNNWRLIVEADL